MKAVSRRAALAVGGGGIAALALHPWTSRAASRHAPLIKQISVAAAAAIAARACPGVQLALAVEGLILFSQRYGFSNLETRSPVGPASVFRIGSITKQFTAAAMLKLSETGRVSLDDPAARYLAFLRPLKPFTIRELLHQTAGLHSDEAEPAPAGPMHRSQLDLARDIAMQAVPFDFDPGTAWHYSNANYIMLGAIVEAVTGMSLAAALAALVIRPLGLARTAFDNPAEIVRGRASGYSPVDGKPGQFVNADCVDVTQAGGAGAMRSTAEDLCRWHHGLLGGRLLGKEALATMLAPGRLRDGRLSGANRFSADDGHYGDVQYASGLLVSPPRVRDPTVLHYGAINGFAAVLETHLERRATIAVLCNADMNSELPFRAIRRSVAAAAASL
jgi:CubicO group peptidase (beta-lactamase class C family)